MLRIFAIFLYIFSNHYLCAEELNLYLRTKPQTVHPFTNSDRSFVYLSYFWNHPLIALNQKWQWECVLCDVLPTPENGKVEKVANGKGIKVKFKFRKDATWGDGKPLRGNDVKLSFEIARSLPGATPRINSFSMIKDVGLDPKDPSIFYLYFEEDGFFYDKLSQIAFVPSHIEEPIWQKSNKQVGAYLEESAYTVTPTSISLYNGSYSLNKFEPSNSDPLELKRLKAFTKKTPFPQLKVLFPASLEELIEKAEADPYGMVPECVIDETTFLEKTDYILAAIERRPTQWHLGDTYSLEHLDFNLRNPILRDPNVRQALAYGLDREAIYRGLFKDYVVPAVSSFHPRDPYFSSEISFYEHNPEKARKLLEEQRWLLAANGFRNKDTHPLRLTLLTSESSGRRKIMDLIAKSWQSIGVEVVKESVNLQQQLLPLLARADYEAVVLSGWRLWFDHSQRPLYGVRFDPSVYNLYRGLNTSHWVNLDADQQFVNFSGSFDVSERAGYMATFQKSYTKELPALPIFYYRAFALLPKKLDGFKIAGHQFPSSLNPGDWKKRLSK